MRLRLSEDHSQAALVARLEIHGIYKGLGFRGMWGSYYNIPEAICYLLKGDYKP